MVGCGNELSVLSVSENGQLHLQERLERENDISALHLSNDTLYCSECISNRLTATKLQSNTSFEIVMFLDLFSEEFFISIGAFGINAESRVVSCSVLTPVWTAFVDRTRR